METSGTPMIVPWNFIERNDDRVIELRSVEGRKSHATSPLTPGKSMIVRCKNETNETKGIHGLAGFRFIPARSNSPGRFQFTSRNDPLLRILRRSLQELCLLFLEFNF